MEDECQILTLRLETNTPVARTDDGKGHPLLEYQVPHEGRTLTVQQYQGKACRAPDMLPAGTNLEIILAPPEDGDWLKTTRHAITTGMVRAGTCHTVRPARRRTGRPAPEPRLVVLPGLHHRGSDETEKSGTSGEARTLLRSPGLRDGDTPDTLRVRTHRERLVGRQSRGHEELVPKTAPKRTGKTVPPPGRRKELRPAALLTRRLPGGGPEQSGTKGSQPR